MSKPRILLVEDEALLAMMMEDILEDLGCEVAASFADIEPALSWLSAGHLVDGAILDVNLGGRMVYPIADALKARGTPFGFVTGYTTPPELQGYSAPVLHKPVDATDVESLVAKFGA